MRVWKKAARRASLRRTAPPVAGERSPTRSVKTRSVKTRSVKPRKSLHKWLALVAQGLCVLGVAYAAANSAHFFWAGPPSEAPAPATARAAAAEPQAMPIEQVRALHLFGKATTNTVAAPAENLQETKLSLTLVGVFVGGQGAPSMAFIAKQGGVAESYVVGDRLPGNAKLAAVHVDRVVIARDGVRELIRFDEHRHFQPAKEATPKAGAATQGAGAGLLPASTGPMATDDTQKLLARHWEAIERDPAKLLRELGVGTAAGGGAGRGYALGTLAERPELNHTGLRSGDKLLSVNGHAVGDPEQDRLRLEDMIAQGSLRLEIQRGERRMFLTVAL